MVIDGQGVRYPSRRGRQEPKGIAIEVFSSIAPAETIGLNQSGESPIRPSDAPAAHRSLAEARSVMDFSKRVRVDPRSILEWISLRCKHLRAVREDELQPQCVDGHGIDELADKGEGPRRDAEGSHVSCEQEQSSVFLQFGLEARARNTVPQTVEAQLEDSNSAEKLLNRQVIEAQLPGTAAGGQGRSCKKVFSPSLTAKDSRALRRRRSIPFQRHLCLVERDFRHRLDVMHAERLAGVHRMLGQSPRARTARGPADACRCIAW